MYKKILMFTREQLVTIEKHAKEYEKRSWGSLFDLTSKEEVTMKEYIEYILKFAINFILSEIKKQGSNYKNVEDEKDKIIFWNFDLNELDVENTYHDYKEGWGYLFINCLEANISTYPGNKEKKEKSLKKKEKYVEIDIDEIHYQNLQIVKKIKNATEEELILEYMSIAKEFEIERMQFSRRKSEREDKIIKKEFKFTKEEFNLIKKYASQYECIICDKNENEINKRIATVKEYLEYMIDEGTEYILYTYVNPPNSYYPYAWGEERYNIKEQLLDEDSEIREKEDYYGVDLEDIDEYTYISLREEIYKIKDIDNDEKEQDDDTYSVVSLKEDSGKIDLDFQINNSQSIDKEEIRIELYSSFGYYDDLDKMAKFKKVSQKDFLLNHMPIIKKEDEYQREYFKEMNEATDFDKEN